MHRQVGRLRTRMLTNSSISRMAWPAVERLNHTVEEFPLSASTLHLSASLGVFSLAYTALAAVHFDAPALAVAGIVARLTKKFRTPVDISLAAMLSNSIPSANLLRLGPLLGVVKFAPVKHEEPSESKPAAVRMVEEAEARIHQAINWAEGPINKYGGAYMMVHWMTGLTVVSTTCLAVHHGLDIMSVVNKLPFLEVESSTASLVSEKASCIAGAMVLNSLSLPFRLYLMSLYARPVFTMACSSYDDMLRGYRSWLRVHLRSSPNASRRLLIRQPACNTISPEKCGF